MRHFIVSDLHGDGNVYDSITGYLENVRKDSNDDITLHINGDLIDRGYDSGRMLMDVLSRVENKKSFKVEYLGGNHELMMYEELDNVKNGRLPMESNWYNNGGYMTVADLQNYIDQDKMIELKEVIGELKLYHKFEETLDGKNIVLVHAKCPDVVNDKCNIKIKDDVKIVDDLVWTRKDDLDIDAAKIGNENYFTIIGHTPLTYPKGYEYYSDENYINIDGGCAAYVLGMTECNHVPLVEIDSKNNRLIILTFNNNNEIISGHYFSEGRSTNIRNLDKYRKYLNKDVKIKKMVYERGLIFFE